MPFPLLVLAGLKGSRALAVILSLCLAIYFWGWSAGREASFLWQITPLEDWRGMRYFALSGIVPAIGYSVCTVMLSLPWLNRWRRPIRRFTASLTHVPSARPDDGLPKTACTWCDAIVVRPTDER